MSATLGDLPASPRQGILTVVSQVNLTLRSVTDGEGSITKMIPCISYSMREATTARSSNNLYVGTEKTRQCLSCLGSWLYWLQPQHWIGLADLSLTESQCFLIKDSSSWSTARAVITSLSALLYIVLLVALVKIIKLIYSSTHCCFKLFRKNEKDQVQQLSEYVLKSMK